MGELRTGVRVRAEGLGITSKTAVTFLVLLYDSTRAGGRGELGLLAFAAGQLAYGVVVAASYLAYYWRDLAWPKRIRSSPRDGVRCVGIWPIRVSEVAHTREPKGTMGCPLCSLRISTQTCSVCRSR